MINNHININYFPSEALHGLITGPAGVLEILSQGPGLVAKQDTQGVVVICHPNPQQGGTMHNKVVYTLAKAYLAKGLKVVRFNYRGVGKSQGEFGDTMGEVADLDAVITWVKKILGETTLLYLAGFSFGAYISACWAITRGWPIAQLMSVAPGVDRHDFHKLIEIMIQDKSIQFNHKKNNWVIVQGDQDEVISAEAVYQWVENLPASLKPYVMLEKFPETGHFFHGKLGPLKEVLMKYILI